MIPVSPDIFTMRPATRLQHHRNDALADARTDRHSGLQFLIGRIEDKKELTKEDEPLLAAAIADFKKSGAY